MSDVSAAVLEKLLDLLDRVKLVEKENERLRQRVGNLELTQDQPVLVPDRDPDELSPLQKEAAQKLGIDEKSYRKVKKQIEDALKLHDNVQRARQQQVLQSQAAAQATASQFGGLGGATLQSEMDLIRQQFGIGQKQSMFDKLRGKKK